MKYNFQFFGRAGSGFARQILIECIFKKYEEKNKSL